MTLRELLAQNRLDLDAPLERYELNWTRGIGAEYVDSGGALIREPSPFADIAINITVAVRGESR